ncbi:hypothetical protein VKS41_000894 [Umbelopsis sp. WA50703]
MYSVGLSVATWNVPTQYNESKYVISSSYTVAFGAILVAPLIFVVSDPFARIILIGVTVDTGVLISVSIFSIPKIWIAIRSGKKMSNSNYSRTKKWLFWLRETDKPGPGSYYIEKPEYEHHSSIGQRVTLSGHNHPLEDNDCDENDLQVDMTPWVAPLQTHSLTDENVESTPHADSAICELANDYLQGTKDNYDSKELTDHVVQLPTLLHGLRHRQQRHNDDLELYGVVGNIDGLLLDGNSPSKQNYVYCPNCVS